MSRLASTNPNGDLPARPLRLDPIPRWARRRGGDVPSAGKVAISPRTQPNGDSRRASARPDSGRALVLRPGRVRTEAILDSLRLDRPGGDPTVRSSRTPRVGNAPFLRMGRARSSIRGLGIGIRVGPLDRGVRATESPRGPGAGDRPTGRTSRGVGNTPRRVAQLNPYPRDQGRARCRASSSPTMEPRNDAESVPAGGSAEVWRSARPNDGRCTD
jgi:hypothetical protein